MARAEPQTDQAIFISRAADTNGTLTRRGHRETVSHGLAIDTGGNLFVADAANAKIRKFTVDGSNSTVAAGSTLNLQDMAGLALDSHSNLYVWDDGHHEIRCPVHGFIRLSEWEMGIVAQPAFQRLRRIRQLAWTDEIYPGAMHTRFEHSLGVMHTATLLYDAIVRNL